MKRTRRKKEDFFSSFLKVTTVGLLGYAAVKVLADDSEETAKWDSDSEMVSHYRNELGTTGLKNFWTLVPKSKLEYYKSLIK